MLQSSSISFTVKKKMMWRDNLPGTLRATSVGGDIITYVRAIG